MGDGADDAYDQAMKEAERDPSVWDEDSRRRRTHVPGDPKELEATVRAFLAAYDETEPHVERIYTGAFVHGIKYDGPTYERELIALREALRHSAASRDGTVLEGWAKHAMTYGGNAAYLFATHGLSSNAESFDKIGDPATLIIRPAPPTNRENEGE
jgi:hypothetical protein